MKRSRDSQFFLFFWSLPAITSALLGELLPSITREDLVWWSLLMRHETRLGRQAPEAGNRKHLLPPSQTTVGLKWLIPWDLGQQEFQQFCLPRPAGYVIITTPHPEQ